VKTKPIPSRPAPRKTAKRTGKRAESKTRAAAPPYAGLTPDRVLDALDSAGWRGDGRLLSLNSYENRVYQVHLEDGSSIVAKFYRPERWSEAQILEEHAFVRELHERELPVVAPLTLPRASDRTLGEFGGFHFAAFPRRGGRAPELEDAETLKWMGRFIGRIHAVGALAPYQHRPDIDPDTFGIEPHGYLLQSGFIPAELHESWDSTCRMALQGVEDCYDRAGELGYLRLHGDCHSGNVLWTEIQRKNEGAAGARTSGGPHFVDFDDSRMGPAVQDLWMLLSGDRESMTRQLSDVLEGYEDFHGFDARELHILEALRTLRLIHYSAWIARRWDDPAFPAAFPWFNTQRYWQDRILELKEQIALMEEEPLAP